jgi:hypothetical protein
VTDRPGGIGARPGHRPGTVTMSVETGRPAGPICRRASRSPRRPAGGPVSAGQNCTSVHWNLVRQTLKASGGPDRDSDGPARDQSRWLTAGHVAVTVGGTRLAPGPAPGALEGPRRESGP